MADKLWPGQDAIGRRLLIGRLHTNRDRRRRRHSHPGAGRAGGRADVLADVGAAAELRGDRGARARGTRARCSRAIQAAVRAVDPVQPVYALRSRWTTSSTRRVAPRRTNTRPVAPIFGAVALLLAGVGVYGVLSYGVAERTREIGVRVALGAQRSDVLGWCCGRGAAHRRRSRDRAGRRLALSRLMSSILYQVSPHDPRVFVGAPLVLGAIALLAVAMPALRATRLDPMVALRRE